VTARAAIPTDVRDEAAERGLPRRSRVLHSLAPGLYGRILPSAFEAANYGRRAMAPGRGQVLAPQPGARRMDGGWRRHGRGDLVRALLDALKGAARGLRHG
jgi:hypothetical protein